jgi:hypothetical protein
MESNDAYPENCKPLMVPTGLVLDGGGQVGAGSVTKQWTWTQSTNLMWTFKPTG